MIDNYLIEKMKEQAKLEQKKAKEIGKAEGILQGFCIGVLVTCIVGGIIFIFNH